MQIISLKRNFYFLFGMKNWRGKNCITFLRWYLRKSMLGAAIKSFPLSHLHAVWMHYFILSLYNPEGWILPSPIHKTKLRLRERKCLTQVHVICQGVFFVLQYWLPGTTCRIRCCHFFDIRLNTVMICLGQWNVSRGK